MNKLNITDLDVAGKTVFMRVDFNVPQNDDGSVRDDLRIRSALPSINWVRERGGKLVLASHLGRPKKVKDDPAKLALLKMDAIAAHLETLVDGPVVKVDEVVGPSATAAVQALEPGGIVLLENTRFHAGEEKNDAELSKEMAALCDGIYISDAFGSVHRAHASTEGICHHVEQAAAGFLVAKEMEYFGKVIGNPERPLTALLGGAKVADKITVLDNLLNLVDSLLIGGGMAYTFLKAKGLEIGESILDTDGLDVAKRAMDKAGDQGVKLLLPIDVVVADAFSADAVTKVVDVDQIQPGWQGLDIGPGTTAAFGDVVQASKTVVWNGPVGVFEMGPYAKGTRTLAELLAGGNMTSIIGGGDTAAAVTQFGYAGQMSHVSTGGGASLEMLEGKTLPGLAALTDK